MSRLFPSQRKRLSLSLAASLAAHLLFALVVTLDHDDAPLPGEKKPEIMDVVLLDPETESHETPEDAKTISNRSARGASKEARDKVTRSAKSPLAGQQRQKPKPAPPRPPKQPPPPEPTPEQRVRTLAKRGQRPERSSDEPPRKHRERPPEPLPTVPMSDLLPSSAALAELSRDFERERRLKQMLSREADIPVNTREAKYAPYAQSLVRALEEQWRPGDANYEEHTEEERQVLMRITIDRNGDLGNLEILRPSPLRRLNESAVEAIHAAAPFKPLPSSWGLDRASFYLTFEVIEDRFVFRTM